MYRSCTTEKSSAQQRAIELSLLDAMQKHSYDDITVRALCEQAGLSRRSFYRLFDSKDDALNALIDHTIADCIKFKLPDDQIAPGLSKDLQFHFAYWHQQKPLLDALQKNQRSSLLLERCTIYIANEDNLTMRIIGADNPRNGIETLVFFMHGFMGLVIYWHHSGFDKTVGEMTSLTLELLSNPPVRFPDLFNYS